MCVREVRSLEPGRARIKPVARSGDAAGNGGVLAIARSGEALVAKSREQGEREGGREEPAGKGNKMHRGIHTMIAAPLSRSDFRVLSKSCYDRRS